MPSHSPISRAPLLASAQDPGMSQRHSISSTSTSESRGVSSGARLGPSARVFDGPPRPFSNKPLPATAPALAPSRYDDEDDELHTLTAAEKQNIDAHSFDITSVRGWANGVTLFVLALAVVGIFALYPIMDFYRNEHAEWGTNTAGYNLGGINASGQYPTITRMRQVIDPDTPEDVKTRTGFDGKKWDLVFSDEFNQEGRTFYEGDDPFWTAMDLHYWPTGDFEWLDPSAVTTQGGHLVITMNQEPIHDLNLKSGMIQSWNQLCFNKNAYFEVSASLPGTSDVGGFWPGVWAMGNLGRPAYGATTEGLWPYTYDSCDVGTLANQTYADGTTPEATLTTGANGGPLSYLPGQRLSSCTCPGEDHPGPNVGVGRAAPEIDMVEAQIRVRVAHGEVSQSFQVAPFDDYYQWDNVTDGLTDTYDTDLTMWNTYLGGSYQQAVSALTLLPDRIYNNQVIGGRSKEFAVFGFEYSSYPEEREKGYIAWVADGKRSWTMHADAIDANSRTEIGRRIIPEEPMAMIINLHASNNFQTVDWANMDFPNYFRIDYVRVYQRADGSGSLGCDPADHPTKDYIERHIEAYSNPNLTTWAAAGKTFPKNRLIDTC